MRKHQKKIHFSILLQQIQYFRTSIYLKKVPIAKYNGVKINDNKYDF